MIFLFLQCVSTVIIVYIIISPLKSYLYIHWILDFINKYYYYYYELYLSSGIVPSSIRRNICARVEKTKHETNEAHPLYGKIPAERRLKSRNCLIHSVKPAIFPLKS